MHGKQHYVFIVIELQQCGAHKRAPPQVEVTPRLVLSQPLG
jgi:hypothetical protein